MTNFASKDLTAGQLNSLVKQVLRILSDELEIQLLSTTSDQAITIPAETSFEDRIKRGNYGWSNGYLTEERFPVTTEQVGDWEWKIFHFNRDISSEEAIRLMKKEGYDAGQIGHILAFGEKYPEEQWKFPIIGLGSVAEVLLRRRVPVLWRDVGRRELVLRWFVLDWRRRCRFLGVRRRRSVRLSLSSLVLGPQTL